MVCCQFNKKKICCYLVYILPETLRKYPGAGGVERVANEDYVVRKGGRLIEKGTMLIIPFHGIHTDPDIYPDPDTFNPDRMAKHLMQQRHPNSFMAYGDGPRVCPGERLVNLQVKLAIINMLSRFQLTINERTIRPVVNYPNKAEIWLNIQRL